jgi:hypothetical protein
MQNIDAVFQTGQVDYPVGAAGIPNPDFLHPIANGFHGLEIVRFEATLDPVQLKPGLSTGSFGKAPEPLQRVPEEKCGVS